MARVTRRTVERGSKALARASTVMPARKPISGRNLPERITAALKHAGFTDKRTGELDKTAAQRALGVRWATLHEWILGTSRPNVGNLLRLAEVCDVDPNELLGIAAGQDPPFPAWQAFLDTPAGRSLTPSQRIALQSFAWPDDEEPDVQSYHMLLAVLQMPRARRTGSDT